MAEAEPDRPSVPHLPIPSRRRLLLTRGLACVAILPLLGFIGHGGKSLWDEWGSLHDDQVSERASAVVGYLNITPDINFASRPPDWFHEEGDASMLWAGWKEGKNQWFRMAQGDFKRQTLSMPLGKDTLQAIDYPIFEQEGGDRWVKIPAEALVVGFEDQGLATAYPIKVLDKVEVVNDLFGDRALLVVCNPTLDGVVIFDAKLEGHRVTMGHSGYFQGRKPILFDRGTESLWSERDGAMVAIAGKRKGGKLTRVAELKIGDWRGWKHDHPGGRLLIGADRSQPKPVD